MDKTGFWKQVIRTDTLRKGMLDEKSITLTIKYRDESVSRSETCGARKMAQ